MINANELNQVKKEEVIKSALEELEEKIKEANKEDERSISVWVERNGWFDYYYKNGKISWGVIINDVIAELKKNGFAVQLYDSYGTRSYTKILRVSW